MSHHAALPDAWVDRIFAKLGVTYGAAFLRRYEGIEIEDVKKDWAYELAMFNDPSGEAIRYGLSHLPADKAPTVLQFRDLCRRPNEHDTRALSLPPPVANPELAAQVRASFNPPTAGAPRDWAHRLRQRELMGERLTRFQREAWRTALRVEAPVEAVA